MGGGAEARVPEFWVRALGPSVPAPGALGDPTLELADGHGTLIASNAFHGRYSVARKSQRFLLDTRLLIVRILRGEMKIISALLKCNRRWQSRISVCGAWLLLVPVCFGEPGMFVETGSLNTARFGHTATLLPNGKVLVAGGMGVDGMELGSAELYDSESGTWTPTGSLVIPRDSHTATFLPNGKVLIAGGHGTSGALASAELYDPATGTWSTTGHLAGGRYYFTATLLPDGKVLVAGGTNLANGSTGAAAELYDPQIGTWTPTGSLVFSRTEHTATLLPNGTVLAAGGFGLDSAQTAELYDPGSGTWTLTGVPLSEHVAHTATLLPNGNVLVAGWYAGNAVDAELFDPATGTWRSTDNLITPRGSGHTATLLENGKVIVVAGDANGNTLGGGELYDSENETWTATGNAPPPSRTYHTATLLENGQVLVAGGAAKSGQVRTSAQLYIGEPPPPILLNISTRMRVLTNDNGLIAGFIITGTDLKRVLIRGIGPSLSGFGVTGTLVDPTLELHQGSTLVVSNDNWRARPDGSSQQADIEATTIPPANDLESAIVAMLSPGAYTAILAGKNGGTGVGLIEIYDLGQGVGSKLANISTRGFVDIGDSVMIGGFIAGGGSGTDRVMVRALGPSLPVAGALADPILELRDGNAMLVASNDNWKMRPDGSSQETEIEATGLAPANGLEAALVQALPAGAYTAIVRGTNNAHGIGLLEIYNLQ